MARDAYIAVVDFGSQYTHLITRTLRELGIRARLLKPTVSQNGLRGAAGIILSGSPASVVADPIPFNRALLRQPVPTLGICYGFQLLMHDRGGRVHASTTREYGPATFTRLRAHPLLWGFPRTSTVWMSHGDSVTKLPEGFSAIGSTGTLHCAAVTHDTRPIYGLQFHPEVHHTTFGQQLYENFAYRTCGLKPQSTHGCLAKIIGEVRAQVGKKKVFLLVSGGVDSTVAFAVLNRALGPEHVYGLHIDTGLMRERESAGVQRALARAGFTNLRVARAGAIFSRALAGITGPERKRQVIGQTFIVVKTATTRKLKLQSSAWMLGQGTIYPDTVESGGTTHADKIKTHHNRIGLLAALARRGRLVEPLKDLYKDEVRALGEELGLPRELLWQHPFPGPGLAVRVLCLSEGAARRLNSLATSIPVARHPSRLLPLLSVGVQGDERSYRQPLALEAPYEQAVHLRELASTLINRHQPINRVVLKLRGPQLGLGSVRAAYLTPARVALARRADAIVREELARSGAYRRLWQCPVVLAPFGVGRGESLILRPFESRDAMTGRAALLPRGVMSRIARRLSEVPGTSYLFYDLTDKPPGTVEWE